MCEVLKVPRSTYYQSFHKVKSSYDTENEEVLARIKIIHAESKGRYGAPKVHYLLEEEDFKVSINRVQRIMKNAGIRSTIVKKYRPTTSTERVEERENLLKQDFATTTINEKWVADITYINTLRNGWCYLASVLDLHTKKIVGYSFSTSMTTELVLQALANAIDVQQPEEVYQTTYIDFETARLALFSYIESWYNRKLIHGAINYLTPQQQEDLCRKEAA